MSRLPLPARPPQREPAGLSFADPHSVLVRLQRKALRRLLSQHSQFQAGAHVVAVHRRRADDGVFTGADIFQRQRGCCGKHCVGVILVSPTIRCSCALTAVQVERSSNQGKGIVLVRRQGIAAVPTGDLIAGNRQCRQRHIVHGHILDAALRRLLRVKPLVSRCMIAAGLRGTLPVQEFANTARSHCC